MANDMAKRTNPAKKQRRKEELAKRQQTQSIGHGEAHKGWLWLLLLALGVTALLYLPTLKYDYVNWDDHANIGENPNLTHVIDASTFRDIFSIDRGAVIGNYNPLPILTFAFEKLLFGTFDPSVTHAGNVTLHLLVIYFVFTLILKLGLSSRAAFIGSLLYGIHPMRVESVTWATERKDVLFALFFFWALNLYVRWAKNKQEGRRGGTALLLGMITLSLLSCLSKVQAVTLPLSMLAIDYWHRRPMTFKSLLEKWPFWATSLCFGLINIHTLQNNNSLDSSTGYTFFHRLLVGLYSFCVYLYKLVLPVPMSPLYPYPATVPPIMYLTPLVFVAIWAGVYLLYDKDKPHPLVFGMAFFFLNVVFMLQIVGAGQGFIADRFTYVPYFGLFFTAAYYFDKYQRENRWRLTTHTAAAIFLGMCCLLTVRQNPIWENSETLWTHVIKLEGKTVETPWGNRARYYRKKGLYEKALEDYSVAIDLPSKHKNTYNSRGKTYFDMSMLDKYKKISNKLCHKAIDDYNRGLEQQGVNVEEKAQLLINLGAAIASLNRLEEAKKHLDAGLKLQPNDKNGHLNRALVLFGLQEYEKATADHDAILRLDPYDLDVRYERGMCHRLTGNTRAALMDFDHVIERRPDMGLAFIERGKVHLSSGKVEAGRSDLRRGIQLGGQVDEWTLRAAGLSSTR